MIVAAISILEVCQAYGLPVLWEKLRAILEHSTVGSFRIRGAFGGRPATIVYNHVVSEYPGAIEAAFKHSPRAIRTCAAFVSPANRNALNAVVSRAYEIISEHKVVEHLGRGGKGL